MVEIHSSGGRRTRSATDAQEAGAAGHRRRTGVSTTARAPLKHAGRSMHELLLFAQVPDSRHDQLLQILAGVAGMPPQRVIERHLIFKPRLTPGQRTTQVGGSQGIQNAQVQALQGQLGGELYHLQLVAEVDEEEFPGDESQPNTTAADQDEVMKGTEETAVERGPVSTSSQKTEQAQPPAFDFNQQAWTLCFSDLPEVAGRRPVTSRMISSIDIKEGDVIGFMEGLGYNFVSEYVLEGYRVFHHNLILLLNRIRKLPPESNSTGSPRKHLPPYNSLDLLDGSGAYMLQASVRVQDGNKPESMTLGISELRAFKEMMKGVVDLDVADRLSLDTRVR
ncbi:MAG: hypothetical protein M1819_005025 [Sarea resinae]|nr:MAG: hypothetical protein M1819_005025 [Sarea resinae]